MIRWKKLRASFCRIVAGGASADVTTSRTNPSRQFVIVVERVFVVDQVNTRSTVRLGAWDGSSIVCTEDEFLAGFGTRELPAIALMAAHWLRRLSRLRQRQCADHCAIGELCHRDHRSIRSLDVNQIGRGDGPSV